MGHTVDVTLCMINPATLGSAIYPHKAKSECQQRLDSPATATKRWGCCHFNRIFSLAEKLRKNLRSDQTSNSQETTTLPALPRESKYPNNEYLAQTKIILPYIETPESPSYSQTPGAGPRYGPLSDPEYIPTIHHIQNTGP